MKWKVAHAVLVALVGVMTDVSIQLTSDTFSFSRAVIAGLVIGGLSRIIGAGVTAYAAMKEAEAKEPEPDNDDPPLGV